MATNPYEYTTVDAAIEAVEAMFRDYADADPDEIGYDVVETVATQCAPEIAAELRRCLL